MMQWPRPRPREAHAAAHLRIVPVDAPSTLDQPPELRLIAVLCGLPHGLVHRVAHCARRALQAFARSDSCAFGGGTRGSAVTIGRRRRAHSVAVRMQLAHTPLGARGPRQPCWREGASRTLEATTARNRGCRTAWLPRPRAAWCGRAKQLAKQLAKQAIGRDQGIGIGRSPARGCAKLTSPLALTCLFGQLWGGPPCETARAKSPYTLSLHDALPISEERRVGKECIHFFPYTTLFRYRKSVV